MTYLKDIDFLENNLCKKRYNIIIGDTNIALKVKDKRHRKKYVLI